MSTNHSRQTIAQTIEMACDVAHGSDLTVSFGD
jgi:hypothetical protein